jgi:hypothetical protein
VTDHTHVVSNGKRELSLDELAQSQPGMDRLMAEVGPRLSRAYHAVQAGNWPLAQYFWRSYVKQLRLSAFLRPKYEVAMERFLAEDCEPVRAALAGQDADAFEAAYQRMVERANDYHGEFGKPYIRWKTPQQPPDDLDLTAGVR